MRLITVLLLMLATIFNMYPANNRYTYFYAQKALAECRYNDALTLYNAAYIINNDDVTEEIQLCKAKMASENLLYPDWMRKCKLVPLGEGKYLAAYFFCLGYGGKTYEEAIDYINDFRLGGFSDWSMPSEHQIKLIANSIGFNHLQSEDWAKNGKYWIKDQLDDKEEIQFQKDGEYIHAIKKEHNYFVPAKPSKLLKTYSIIDNGTGINIGGTYSTPEIEVNTRSDIFMVREFDGSSYDISDKYTSLEQDNSEFRFLSSGVYEKKNGNLYILLYKDDLTLDDTIKDTIAMWATKNKRNLKNKICHILLLDNWCASGIGDEAAWKTTSSIYTCIKETKISTRYINWVHSTRLDNLYNFGEDCYNDAIWVNVIVVDRQVENVTSDNSESNDDTQIEVTGTFQMNTRVKTNITWKSTE